MLLCAFLFLTFFARHLLSDARSRILSWRDFRFEAMWLLLHVCGILTLRHSREEVMYDADLHLGPVFFTVALFTSKFFLWLIRGNCSPSCGVFNSCSESCTASSGRSKVRREVLCCMDVTDGQAKPRSSDVLVIDWGEGRKGKERFSQHLGSFRALCEMVRWGPGNGYGDSCAVDGDRRPCT